MLSQQPTFSAYLAVFALLVLFGVGYNALVAWMERRKIEGYTWAQVVVGVAAAVSASAVLIGWQAALVVLGCLFFAGVPMIVGAIWRHHKKLEAFIERLAAHYRTDA